ncbi:hypothetical protein K432DRAFT_395871 [Lepidopterella palustris CBS 459.81]|uniref:Uncharacterized protein n=1 Tax=Lepidopterella palustris CBS 459.81 TaxID=1314670 RepID=A0A8E2E4B6_9PEZI|nr:hypothetical protein K432DRAFT_395871 [Lepidopterella palustris CBS 459.81]
MAPNDSWLTRTMNTATAGVGNFAGGIVSAVGNGISGAGRGAGSSITSSTRIWGDSVRGYGNSIKDATGATGPRASTADNPLGMARSATSVKIGQQAKKGSTGGTARGSARDPLGLERSMRFKAPSQPFRILTVNANACKAKTRNEKLMPDAR